MPHGVSNTLDYMHVELLYITMKWAHYIMKRCVEIMCGESMWCGELMLCG